MPRFIFLAAIFAGIALIAGSAVWFRAALNETYRRGELAGRAEMQGRYLADRERQQSAADAALAKSSRDVAELEISREKLQEQLDDLATSVHRAADIDTTCLGADVVRALAGIGRNRSGPGARP